MNRKLAVYGAAAGATLAMAGPAQADIVYSGAQNLTLTASDTIDLDGDSAVDVSFTTFAGGMGTSSVRAVVSARSNAGAALNLALDSAISSSGTWGNPVVLRAAGGPPPGNFQDRVGVSGAGYLGIRFNPGGAADWHYGWVYLGPLTSRTASFTVRDWAYESDAGVAILAGDTGTSGGGDPVPEPSSLALLAMGAAGLAAYRRKRDAA